MTSPVVLFVRAQSSLVLCTLYLGDYIGGCMGGRIFATWLAMVLWPFRCIVMVLYMRSSGMLHVLPWYGYGSGYRTSVSSGMTWGSVRGCLFLCPGVIVIFAFLFSL